MSSDHSVQDASLPRFAVAFQPIVAPAPRRVVAHEALLRGRGGTPAGGVLGRVPPRERARFEQAALAAALSAFAATGARSALHVNACPVTLARAPDSFDPLAEVAGGEGAVRIVVEMAEGGSAEPDHLARAAAEARARGLAVALDQFGTGYGGLGLLDLVRPSVAKLDMSLCRGIHLHRARRSIVAALLAAAAERAITVVAVGVESEGEYRCLAGLGVALFQGFLFAPPVTGEAPGPDAVAWPPASAPPWWSGGSVARAVHARDV